MNPISTASRKPRIANGTSTSSGMPMIDTASTTMLSTSTGTNSSCARSPVNPLIHGSRAARSPIRSTTRGATSTATKTSINTIPSRRSVPTRRNQPENMSHPTSEPRKSPGWNWKFGGPNRISLTCPRMTAPCDCSMRPPTDVTSPRTTAFGPRCTLPPTATTSSSTCPSTVTLPPTATTGSETRSSASIVMSPPMLTRAALRRQCSSSGWSSVCSSAGSGAAGW